MIPQAQPWIEDDDVEAVVRAIRSTYVTEHDQTRRFEQMLRELTGARHAIAYANATCGLFAAMRALGVGPGDEVIVPDLTFVASANAVILAGATPVFCDVDAESMAIDVSEAQKILSARTKAIMPVHLYGGAADMDRVIEFARQHGLAVIEDAAQGVGVRFRGRHVGTFGDVGVLSFYGNKTMTTAEGGAILTDDDALAERCYRLKNHGRMEKGVFVHEEIGFNFAFSDLHAALGVSQLEKLDRIIAEKLRIRQHYEHALAGADGITFQEPSPHVTPVHWFTNICCDDVETLQVQLRELGVETRRFFYPLHLQPCYQQLNPATCPVSAQLYDSWLSLPSWCGITASTLDDVCNAIAGCAVVG